MILSRHLGEFPVEASFLVLLERFSYCGPDLWVEVWVTFDVSSSWIQASTTPTA